MTRTVIASCLSLVIAGTFGLTWCGCASLPPESEAARLRDSVVRFAEAVDKVADQQLADASEALADLDPSNDAAAHKVQDKATRQKNIVVLIRTVLTGTVDEIVADAMTKLFASQKDPLVGALAIWVIGELQAWQKADAAAKVVVVTETKGTP